MRRTRATAVALLTTLALTGLASCSSDDEPDDTSSPAAQGEGGTDTPGDAPDGAGESPPALDRPRPAQRALVIEACPPGEGELVAKGTVRNREKKARDFVITVDWLDEQSAVAVSKVAVLEQVPPGEPTPWEVSADVGVTTISCNARASSGSLLD